jgi:hypothetical protein
VVDKNVHGQYSKLTGVEIQVSHTARHFIMWNDPQWMFGYLDKFVRPLARTESKARRRALSPQQKGESSASRE